MNRRLSIVASGILTLGACSPSTTVPPPSGGSGITWVEPWLEDCDSGCDAGYEAYLDRHGSTEPEALSQLERIEASVHRERRDLDADELRQVVLDGLAIQTLIDGADERPLTVARLATEPRSGFTAESLLFGDPEVGSFEALLLRPDRTGPMPAVIGLHGHRHDPARFTDEYLGAELAAAGFMVLMPRFRAFDCSWRENELARRFLENGSTLMGLRVYETLLMVRFLASLDEVDASRIGLLGHSGGSTVADLAMAVIPSVRAKVTDHSSHLLDRCGPGGVHCETLPTLAPWAEDLRAEADRGRPFLKVPYKYRDAAVRPAIRAFFQNALGPSRSLAAPATG